MALPKRRTRWKSEDFLRRNRLFTVHNWARVPKKNRVTSASEAMPALALPVDLLDVVVHRHTQALTALGAAASEHILSAAGCHAGAEAVNTHTTSDFGLVRSFWHVFPLLD
jgi:hypothetical protein